MEMLLKIVLFLSVPWGCFSIPVVERGHNVGCVKCNPVDPKRLNLHFVPHSHDDVGWVKTYLEYYNGEVQYIIDTVIDALAANPERRFIQVETAYFWKWWNAQTNSSRKELFKSLVDNGQIEMVNGAWSMNDEACTNYQSTIDQFTWGLRTLRDTIGECATPRVGWQIDPFGHSREQTSLLSQMGYDGVFFARLHQADSDSRKKRHALDFAWQGSNNLDNSIIFTGVFPNGLYFPPEGHCYDYACGNTVNKYNLQARIANLKSQVKGWASFYPTNNILITMGGDFHYQKASFNFENMDRLLEGMKGDPEVNAFYSTPSCYINAVHRAEPKLELYKEDFFPYRQDEHTYWTGYFSSRPNTKRFERVGHNILQSTKQLAAYSSAVLGSNHDENIRKLREAMGIMQHHDAITGTEKQYVANDYVKLLTEAIHSAEEPMGEIVRNILKKSGQNHNIFPELSSCLLSNVSVCTVSQNEDRFLVVAHNPTAWITTDYIRLPVQDGFHYVVNGPDGFEDSDIVPSLTSYSDIPEIPQMRRSKAELVFAARNMPPMGLKVYHIARLPREPSEPILEEEPSAFEIDPATNLLKSVTLNGITLEISQNFYYYLPETDKPSSGAYIFRPKTAEPQMLTGVTQTNNFKGKLVHEFHKKWTTSEMDIVQSIRWYKTENYLEFDWLVGNLDKSESGKELIIKFTINDFDNKGVFYTDSNGREMITRARNRYPGFDDDFTNEPVASNYYPITSQIVTKDEERDLSVAILNDRAQGGSSLKGNEIEFLIHRRLVADDDKGVGENLDEKEYGREVYVRGSHYLTFGKAKERNSDGRTTIATSRLLAQKKLLQPWVGVSKTHHSFEDLQKEVNLEFRPLKTSLPDNVNLLTFEPWRSNSIILRFEHILEKNDDPELSKRTEIDLKNILVDINTTHIREKTLSANENLTDFSKRPMYTWKLTTDTESTTSNTAPEDFITDNKISLSAMEIRTFEIIYD